MLIQGQRPPWLVIGTFVCISIFAFIQFKREMDDMQDYNDVVSASLHPSYAKRSEN